MKLFDMWILVGSILCIPGLLYIAMDVGNWKITIALILGVWMGHISYLICKGSPESVMRRKARS